MLVTFRYFASVFRNNPEQMKKAIGSSLPIGEQPFAELGSWLGELSEQNLRALDNFVYLGTPLGPETKCLPIALDAFACFRLAVQAIRRRIDAGILGDEEVRFLLSDWQGRPDFHFTFCGRLRVWRSDVGMLLDNHFRDSNKAKACREYLARQGRRFTTTSEVIAAATKEDWPRAEKLIKMIAGRGS
jgi:hypothetical protein